MLSDLSTCCWAMTTFQEQVAVLLHRQMILRFKALLDLEDWECKKQMEMFRTSKCLFPNEQDKLIKQFQVSLKRPFGPSKSWLDFVEQGFTELLLWNGNKWKYRLLLVTPKLFIVLKGCICNILHLIALIIFTYFVLLRSTALIVDTVWSPLCFWWSCVPTQRTKAMRTLGRNFCSSVPSYGIFFTIQNLHVHIFGNWVIIKLQMIELWALNDGIVVSMARTGLAIFGYI